jgi:DNA-binding transcriptional ArsR family regulator
VLSRLAMDELPVSTLAQPFDMALPSFAQHLKVLEDCGLIVSEKRGRSRWCRLVQARFDEAADWMEAERGRWARRLDRLEVYLDKTEEDEAGHGRPV